jgi:hypothetical protein
MIKMPKQAPKLRCKGAETRHLVPFCLELALKFLTEDPHTHLRYECILQLANFYLIMSTEPFDPAAARSHAEAYLSNYTALSKEAQDGGSLAWRIKPKHHLFYHLGCCQVTEIGNPAFFWAYQDEGFVGLLGKMAKPRGGPQGVRALVNVMQKYRILQS